MKPLQGVRIVSVEQFGAAPYGTMLLADLGAEPGTVAGTAFGKFLADDTAKWAKVIKVTGANIA